MTLTKIEFASGIIKDDAPLAAEGGFIDCDHIRFRQGKAETIGGWELTTTQQFTGKARGGISWIDLTGSPQAAFGTADKLYAYTGGVLTDITPPHSEGTLYDLSALSVNKTANYTIVMADSGYLIYVPNSSAGGFTLTLSAAGGTLTSLFSCYIRNFGTGAITLAPTGTDKINGTNASISIAAGATILVECDGTKFTTTVEASYGPLTTTSGSTTVTVTHAAHGLKVGQTITYSNVTNVGGVTISGAYTVVALLSRDKYTITAGGAAASTATGGFLDYVASWQNGLTDGLGGLGYGTGAYGTGAYGLPSQSDFLPTVWSLDNSGETLLAVRQSGPLYAWQPAISYPEIVLNGDFASSASWSQGTNWSIAAGIATATAASSILSQNVEGSVKAGYVYRLKFTATVASGYVQFRVNAGSTPAVIDVGSASAPIVKSGTYSRLVVMPDTPFDIAFEAFGFTGTIDNVSLKLENMAFIVHEAPEHIDAMFVDSNRVVVLLGTIDAAGTYNPMLVRWSGQENYRQWVPDANTIAGEEPLARGGQLISGLASRQQNLLWSNEAMYSMQATGDTTTAYSIRLLGTGCGLIGQNAVAEHNGIAFWLSNNGNFYIFQGAIPQVIDCRLRRDMFSHISASQQTKTFAGVNAAFSEIWWLYPDSRDGTDDNPNLECSRYVAFNWIENYWTCGTLDRTTWIAPGVFKYPIALGSDGYIYYHEAGNSANGGVLDWFLESAYFDIEDGDKLLKILRIIPEFENQIGDVDFYLYTKSEPNHAAVSGGPYTATPTTRDMKMRRLGRQAKVRLEGAAANMFMRMGSLRFDTEKTSARR